MRFSRRTNLVREWRMVGASDRSQSQRVRQSVAIVFVSEETLLLASRQTEVNV